jgi:hypothetical protein
VDGVSVRPIDLQVLIPRTTEISRIQQVSDHQAALQQQQSAAEWERLAANRQQQVQKPQQNAGGRVEPDAQENKREHEGDQRHDRRRPADEDEIESADPIRGHTIDIKT